MRAVILLALSAVLFFAGCASFNPVATPQGSVIAAKVADKVIQAGLIGAANALDRNEANPYLHSVATALRENSGDIVDPADIQRLAKNYGDPENQHKFKQLASDLWTILKNATVQYGKVKGTELIASALNNAASASPKARTSADGP